MYNMLGQKVIQKEISNAANTAAIPVAKLAAGVYVVSLQNAGKKYAVKVVITR